MRPHIGYERMVREELSMLHVFAAIQVSELKNSQETAQAQGAADAADAAETD